MLNGLIVPGLALAVAAANPTLPMQNTPYQPLSPLEERLLAAHNRERAKLGVGALSWDSALAAAAASYGPALATLPGLVHSPRAGRPGQRENLWMGSRGYYSPEQMVGTWADERALLRSGVFPMVSATGRWEDVGHYTQMVWPSTTRVGCAVHSSQTNDYLICRYTPPGNVDGTAIPTAWLR